MTRTVLQAAAAALGSEPERALGTQLRQAGIPHRREYPVLPDRKWRFDFAFPGQLVAVEIDGGTWTGGRHVRGQGYRADIDKHNAAVLAGWRVLRVVPEQVESGEALALVERALKGAVR